MKKILISIIIAIIAIAAILIFVWRPKVTEQPTPTEESPETATSGAEISVEEGIGQELQGIDLGDLEKEFEAIDKDLQSL